jgi:two-component system, cell cycle sensor histidine kinase and response regulator CckA
VRNPHEEKSSQLNYNTPHLLTAKILEVLGLRRRRRIVLVIDIEEAVRTFVCQTLGNDGYEVVEACDGQSAMTLLRQQQIHLVFSDLVTFENDGVDTIRRMRRLFPNIKIVAMSGEIPPEVLKMCSLLGADAALPKPIAVEVLLQTTHRLLAD